MAATAEQAKVNHSADDERNDERRAMDRYQDREDQGRRDVRDRARRELGHASNAGRDAVRSYVRANTTLMGLLIPPAFLRPGEMLRTAFDLIGETFNIQRAFVDESVLAFRNTVRVLDREAERDERVANNDEYGFYSEDDEYENGDLDDERRALQRERRANSGQRQRRRVA